MLRHSGEEFYDYFYPRSKELKKILYNEIKTHGKISFATYMNILLYHQDYGYYTHREACPYDDYLTSPKLHIAFGELITERIVMMWEIMGKPLNFFIVETAPGDGELCRQILNYAESYRDFYESLHYIILNLNNIEIYEKKDKISQILYKDLSIPLRNVKGCFISNELIDSFPVHLIARRGEILEEIFVTMKDGDFIEIYDSPSIEAELCNMQNLPDGHRIEINPRALTWLGEAAKSLEKGYILTIDYGYNEEDIFQYKNGTLNCFYHHTFNRNPFKRPGYQDITAHVNFTAFMRDGEKLGLNVEEYTTQRDFLISLGIEKKIESLDRSVMNLLDYNSQLNSLNRLIDDRGLGNIKVLIQKNFY